MNKTTSSLLALALLLPAVTTAKTVRRPGVPGFCGTSASTTALSYARHRFNQRRLDPARSPVQRAVAGGGAVTAGPEGMKGAAGISLNKQKNIAVIEDDGTLFPPPNLFDLTNRGVQFFRAGRGTRAQEFFGGISDARGNQIEIGDDQSRVIDLPFGFTFYGRTYNRVFLNSDGNLTFEQEDSASTARSLSRFLEGPPRIAVDFVDLDPSTATGGGDVYLLVEAGRARITWDDVPRFGLTDSNSFQVTLYPNGRITMAFGGIASGSGIVGVSPGGPGTINLIDLSQQLPVAGKRDAIAEEFREDSQIDDLAVARAVLSGVRDEYDMIVLFADFPVELDGALAYNAPIKNDIRGIGDAVGYDLSNLYGSNGRLEAFVQMGSLANYPRNPNNFVGLSEAPGIGILAHEVGHRWLAFTRFMRQGQPSADLLGRQQAHWSFVMDSDGSVMEGNEIRDDGGGRFTTVATWQGFSLLDQYLMGFRRPDEVPPFFYVANSGLDAAAAPDTGVIITGNRRDVTLQQIIAAEGPRVPDFANSQKKIQVAFALLGQQGEPPSLDSVKKVNQYRNRLATYFRQQTADRGRIATWLRLKRQTSVAPAAAAVAEPATTPAADGDPTTSGGDTPVASDRPSHPRQELIERFDRLAERIGN